MNFRVLVFLLLGLLASCSRVNTTGDGPQAEVSTAKSNVYSQGLGEQSSFSESQYENSSDLRNKNCLSAPEHQVYHFAFDNSLVSPQDRPCINAQAYYLKQDYRRHVWLYGNTDERGSREYNIALGERRANSVADLLKLQGVRASQITVISYGQEKPVDRGHTESAYRKNRRVELYYKGPSYVG